jgi:large subunit ribosomal protein L3
MTIGLVGFKEGTRQIFWKERAVQVTYLTVLPNRIVQIKAQQKEGYSAIQLTTDEYSAFRLSKAEAGHFIRSKVAPGRGLHEFRFSSSSFEVNKDLWHVGQELSLANFDVQWVDITATSKGKGFQGAIKRWGFASQDATHGNSLSHRAPGSIGQRQSPGRVFKGKKMAGQLGNKRCTIQSLEVLASYPEHHLLIIKGSVPGAPGAKVIIRPAVRCHKIQKAV